MAGVVPGGLVKETRFLSLSDTKLMPNFVLSKIGPFNFTSGCKFIDNSLVKSKLMYSYQLFLLILSDGGQFDRDLLFLIARRCLAKMFIFRLFIFQSRSVRSLWLFGRLQ